MLRKILLALSAFAVVATVVAGGASAGSVAAKAVGPGSAAGTAAPTLSWHFVKTHTSPGKRSWFGMAYDAADKYTVLYGGYDGFTSTLFSDTWTFVSGTWTQLNPAQHPSADSGLVLVYDPSLNGVVAFGGEGPFGSAYYNDTWLFQNGTWTQLAPTVSPPARSQYSMAYDAIDSEIVLFGGYNGGSHEMSDTWVFNGATWARATSTATPAGRQFASMVYDPIIHKTLLVGGVNSTLGGTADTWAFKAGQWSQLTHANTQSRVHTPITAMGNGTPFFFGGQSGANTTIYNTSYEFFGGSWHQVSFGGRAPTPRENGGLVYDGIDGHLMMFGGGTYPIYWAQTFTIR